MKDKLAATQSIKIKAPKSKVWEALTKPELIKKYFFGTEAISDWKKGSPLTFRGVWEGKEYVDKGTIVDIEKEKLLKYSYWSSFSGKPDAPENYQMVTYTLRETNGSTEYTVVQEGVESDEARKHSESNWATVMKDLKNLLES